MSESSCTAQQVPDGAGPAFASDVASSTTDGPQSNWFVNQPTLFHDVWDACLHACGSLSVLTRMLFMLLGIRLMRSDF